jgi:hypothetical protein
VSKCSQGTVSQFGYAFFAAASLYAPAQPWIKHHNQTSIKLSIIRNAQAQLDPKHSRKETETTPFETHFVEHLPGKQPWAPSRPPPWRPR